MYSDSDRVIALAGVFQSARLTWQLAHQGDANSDAMEASINSLFQTSPDSVVGVFGGIAGVESGLHCMVNQLDDPQHRSAEITQYAISLLQLARKLGSDKTGYARLGEALNNLRNKMDSFNFESTTRFAQLAEIYSDHVSSLGPRIMVKGDPRMLENTANAARIRSVLLSGIRAAHLWYQCGGKRWQLLIYRKRMLLIARQALRYIAELREGLA